MDTIVQGSPEWKALRSGKVTASKIAALMAKTKSGWGASRANYKADLIAERLTGVPAESFTSGAMQHGIDTEPMAKETYAFLQGVKVTEVAFVPHPKIDMAGASPDGLVDDDGLVEIKCPNTATHLETLLGAPIEDKYLKQMQFQMACTGRQWCDFVSFDDRLPARMQLFVKRVERDPVMIAEIESAVRAFLKELDEELAELNRIYPEPSGEPCA